jgi:uncharacterized repeat protein (TIGR03803 family)
MTNPVRVLTTCAGLFLGTLDPPAFSAEQPSPTVTTLYKFKGSSIGPSFPTSITSSGGVMYGVAEGRVFSLMPPMTAGLAWTETTLYEFTGGSSGAIPVAVVMGASGVLYGVTYKGGTSNYGTVFSLTPPAVAGGTWTPTILLNLRGKDGAWARGVTVGSGGVLYVVAEYGGLLEEGGTILSLTPPTSGGGPWTETVLHEFTGGTRGQSPYAPVVIGSGGVLYGAALGTESDNGVVFSLTPPESQGGPWTYAVLGSVSGAPDGGVVIGAGGVLYGTGGYGGTYNEGTAFSVVPPSSPGGRWTTTTLYSFMWGTDGALPQSSLVIGGSGVLYGVTPYGGNGNFTSPGNGTIFSLTPPAESGGTWTEAVQYTFTDGSTGAFPGGLILTLAGKFYGFAEVGNPSNTNGSFFSFEP